MAHSTRHTPIFNNALGSDTADRRASNRVLRHTSNTSVRINGADEDFMAPDKNELPACDPNSWGGDGRVFEADASQKRMRK